MTIIRNGECFDLVWSGDVMSPSGVKGGLLAAAGYEQSTYARLAATTVTDVAPALVRQRGVKDKARWVRRKALKIERGIKLPLDAPWHGRPTGYIDHCCNCPKCKDYQRRKSAEWKAKQRALKAQRLSEGVGA